MIKLQRPITLSIVCTQLCSNLEKRNFPFVLLNLPKFSKNSRSFTQSFSCQYDDSPSNYRAYSSSGIFSFIKKIRIKVRQQHDLRQLYRVFLIVIHFPCKICSHSHHRVIPDNNKRNVNSMIVVGY